MKSVESKGYKEDEVKQIVSETIAGLIEEHPDLNRFKLNDLATEKCLEQCLILYKDETYNSLKGTYPKLSEEELNGHVDACNKKLSTDIVKRRIKDYWNDVDSGRGDGPETWQTMKKDLIEIARDNGWAYEKGDNNTVFTNRGAIFMQGVLSLLKGLRNDDTFRLVDFLMSAKAGDKDNG